MTDHTIFILLSTQFQEIEKKHRAVVLVHPCTLITCVRVVCNLCTIENPLIMILHSMNILMDLIICARPVLQRRKQLSGHKKSVEFMGVSQLSPVLQRRNQLSRHKRCIEFMGVRK